MVEMAQYGPQAVFFDMDGTIINSEPLWAQSERAIMKKYDIAWPAGLSARLQGTSLAYVAQALINLGLPLSQEETIDAMVSYVHQREAVQLPWIDGAQEFIGRIHQAGIPCLLVTGSPRILVENLVSQTPEGTFAGFICDDSLPDNRKKPLPDPYFAAASLLGIDPEDKKSMSRCLIFEDSAPGLKSASQTGAVVVRKIGETSTAFAEEGGQFMSVSSFEGMSVDDTALIMREAHEAGYVH